jgi:homogentisate phytyltransferase / homogentisate geranylgeranyltransferase
VQKLVAFWQFSRPHTIVGTSLSVTALFAIASTNFFDLSLDLSLWLWALIACFAGNIYIVGLNQLEDIEIDKINKPSLPLASGDLSIQAAWIIVAITGLASVAIAFTQGIFLLLTIVASLIIGTAYSVKPIRLKRFPFWASVCIFSVRGIIVNLGLYLHFSPQVSIPARVWLLTLFVLIFTYVIAIFKDMPDIEGDRKFNVATLSINLGQITVFNLSRQILVVLYLGMSIVSLSGWITNINSLLVVITHVFLALIMWSRSLSVDLSDRAAITSFYQFIWKLFYLEYIIFPIACLVG